jgi:hypothetical protein
MTAEDEEYQPPALLPAPTNTSDTIMTHVYRLQLALLSQMRQQTKLLNRLVTAVEGNATRATERKK